MIGGYLLEILLAEVGSARLDHREQTADHLRHAVEVAGARGTLHDLVYLTEVERARVGLGIYLVDGGHEYYVGAGAFEHAAILFGCSGVVSQIVLIVELRRVDEYAHYDRAVLAACTFHQRAVACMQRPHGGDESDVVGVARGECLAQLTDCINDLHFSGILTPIIGGAKLQTKMEITRKDRKIGLFSSFAPLTIN